MNNSYPVGKSYIFETVNMTPNVLSKEIYWNVVVI